MWFGLENISLNCNDYFTENQHPAKKNKPSSRRQKIKAGKRSKKSSTKP